MPLAQILHDIVKLLPHRQEALDELHERIDAETGGAGTEAAPETTAEGVPEA